MPRSLCWKNEYTDFMCEVCPGRLTPEVTEMLNEKFGTNYTKQQVAGVRRRLGLPVGEVFKKKIFTKEQHDYFVANHEGKTAKDFTDELNAKFGLSLKKEQVKSYRANNNLDSGLTGWFEKGHVPVNKGKKFPDMPPNSGQFQKGHKPRNWVPVGTVNYNTDGYPKRKIAEPDKWVLCHREEWEKYNGPIPNGYSIAFLDGDKTNWDISNLACLSKNEMARMNQKHFFTSDPELTKSGIGLTKLTNKIREVEKNG